MNDNRLYNRLSQEFSDLIFEESTHRYFVNTGGRLVNLPSVSSIVSSYAPKFNEAKYLSRCAQREGISELELKKKWQLINQTACDLGRRVHSFLENYTGVQTPTLPQEQAGINFIKSLQGKYSIQVRELRAYCMQFSYAGTMDLPIVNIETSKLVVADYKTNGDLFKSYDYLYKPFNYLDSSPYNKYQIQLSLYQILLEERGYEVEDRWLVHLRADGTYKIFSLYDFTNDLRINLADRKFVA